MLILYGQIYNTVFFSDVQTWRNNSTYTVEVAVNRTRKHRRFGVCVSVKTWRQTYLMIFIMLTNYVGRISHLWTRWSWQFLQERRKAISSSVCMGYCKGKIFVAVFEGYLDQIPFDGINVVEVSMGKWMENWKRGLCNRASQASSSIYLLESMVPTLLTGANRKSCTPYPWSENIKGNDNAPVCAV